VSVFDFSVEKTLDGAEVGAGNAALDERVVAEGRKAAGFGEPCDSAAAEIGAEPPILSMIVGGGGGASVCWGRSKGGGGWTGNWIGVPKPFPGTNS